MTKIYCDICGTEICPPKNRIAPSLVGRIVDELNCDDVCPDCVKVAEGVDWERAIAAIILGNRRSIPQEG